ncbi:MAG: hypothetical protein M3N13_01815 [Candidatus Eremiobacteraeota bacterium]|nr:hypothetical protein [Candidatus Eremiobacteraeota bacterium]
MKRPVTLDPREFSHRVVTALPKLPPASRTDELTALAAAAIAPNDTARATAFLRKRLDARIASERIPAGAKQSHVPFVSPLAARQVGARERIMALVAERTPLKRERLGPLNFTPPTAGMALQPAPIIGDLFVNGDDTKDEIIAGDTLLISGLHFTAGGQPRILLDFGTCGTRPLDVQTVADDHIVARVPEIGFPAIQTGVRLSVESGTARSGSAALKYDPPLDEVNVLLYLDFKIHQSSRVSDDGGIGLVEGQSMNTSSGGERWACCGASGKSDADFFMTNQTLRYGWVVADNFLTMKTCLDPQNTTCDVAFLKSPTTAETGIWQLYSDHRRYTSRPAASPPTVADLLQMKSSPDTRTLWSFADGSALAYEIAWAFIGPRGYDPFPWRVPVHMTSCFSS